MRVMICGGTGFIGTALSKALLDRGDEVWIVTRQLPAAPAAGFLYVTWEEWSDNPGRWNGIDAIVNLAGESVGKRWTEETKRRILISRTQTALHISDIVRRMDDPPKVLVSASGISLYGHSHSPILRGKRRARPKPGREAPPEEPMASVTADLAGIRGFTPGRPEGREKGVERAEEAPFGSAGLDGTDRPASGSEPDGSDVEQLLRSMRLAGEEGSDWPASERERVERTAAYGWFDESSPANPEDFLGSTVVAWEEAVDRIPVERIVKLRISMVLGRKGGSFPLLRLPYRLFAGGRMGSGTQGFPWIHLKDMVSLILFSLDNPALSGAVNAVAPDPVNNDQFGRTLAKVTRRPHWFHVPASLLKLVLGEQSVLLHGQHAYPRKALDHGFVFAYPRLEDALREVTGSSAR
ncbi:epimerase [Cohnella thermotolerans]|uniref:epimerase n=1 Tax=Cohnella thermotolerans TaxID=329858 RepID=UPI0006850C7F|nr:DUF1731 domain-containing protein [Cohnella thermotolerans]